MKKSSKVISMREYKFKKWEYKFKKRLFSQKTASILITWGIILFIISECTGQ